MIQSIFMLSVLVFSQPTGPAGEWDSATLELAKTRERVAKRLSDESLWTDPKNKQELLACLKTARTLPDVKLAPLLLKHISYVPGNPHPLDPPEEYSPAFAA